MQCRKCKKAIPDGAVFCNFCGIRQIPEKKAARKRANGEGCVTWNGYSWTLRVSVCVNGNMLYKKKKGYATKRDAYADVPNLKNELLHAKPEKAKEVVTLATLYEPWADSYLPTLSKLKQSSYKIAYNKLKKLHHVPFANLMIEDLQEAIKGMTYYPARDIKAVLSHLQKSCRTRNIHFKSCRVHNPAQIG